MPHHHMSTSGRTVAFIDLGTNSVRLLVVRLNPNHSHSILTSQREAVRLGENEFTHDLLQPQAMARATMVSRKFVELARQFGATEIIAVATAATREAANRTEFQQRFLAETGLELHVISGREEARLIYLGVAAGVHLEERQALFIDIGGGSTELAVGSQREFSFLDSLKLGAIRLTTLFPFAPNAPVPAAKYDAMRQHVRSVAVRALQQLQGYTFDAVYGSSGTIESLAAVAAHLRQQAKSRAQRFTLTELQHVARHLCGMTMEERRKVAGLSPERADIIIGGMAIIHTLMEELHLDAVTPSDRGLRDGLLVDYLSRTVAGAALYADLSVRARSVLQLGRLCGFDERHAAHTARLALELFDSGQALGLHDQGTNVRELLEWAAQLHDIGAFLSYTNHHRHGYYFIRNADLLGFDARETDVMAATVYFHRKALPRKRDPEFAALSPADQETVCVLCVLLRLAESLDRSHAGLVSAAAFRIPDAQDLILEAHATQECALELWSVRAHHPAIRKTFSRRLVVEYVTPDRVPMRAVAVKGKKRGKGS